jgi:cell division protein FtsX
MALLVLLVIVCSLTLLCLLLLAWFDLRSQLTALDRKMRSTPMPEEPTPAGPFLLTDQETAAIEADLRAQSGRRAADLSAPARPLRSWSTEE